MSFKYRVIYIVAAAALALMRLISPSTAAKCTGCSAPVVSNPQYCVGTFANCMNGIFGTGHAWTYQQSITQTVCANGTKYSCTTPQWGGDCCTQGSSSVPPCPSSTCS